MLKNEKYQKNNAHDVSGNKSLNVCNMKNVCRDESYKVPHGNTDLQLRTIKGRCGPESCF